MHVHKRFFKFWYNASSFLIVVIIPYSFIFWNYTFEKKIIFIFLQLCNNN